MNKHILQALMVCTAAFLTGCNNPYQEQVSTENLDAKYENHNIISLSAAAAESESRYTIEDLRNLQDFLLVRETSDLSGKDYDLDGDGSWNVFDLCLMKREFLESMVRDDIPIVYMTKDISSSGLMNTYLALEWTPGENTAVKLSTGEPHMNASSIVASSGLYGIFCPLNRIPCINLRRDSLSSNFPISDSNSGVFFMRSCLLASIIP